MIPPPRSRVVYGLALVAVIAAGLGSRVYGASLPAFVATYAGDTLYATMIVVGLALLSPRRPTGHLVATALALSVAIEISQLYHAPWIDAIRRTTPGALVLGYGFLWSDVACYVMGAVLGGALDLGLKPAKDRAV